MRHQSDDYWAEIKKKMANFWHHETSEVPYKPRVHLTTNLMPPYANDVNPGDFVNRNLHKKANIGSIAGNFMALGYTRPPNSFVN